MSSLQVIAGVQVRGLIKPHIRENVPFWARKVTSSLSDSSDDIKSVDNESRGNKQRLL